MEEKKRKFTGIWIPKEVYLDERLSALEKIILVEIDSLDGEDGCFASNEYLAKFCQCSKNKISSAISKLVELNYLEVISFDGRKRFLKSCLTNNGKLPKNVSVPPKKCEAESQKMGHININNNITNKSTNTNVLVEAKPRNYGNSQINELFDKWEECCGFRVDTKVKANRYACNRLIKSRGFDKVMNALPYVAESQVDKFAPKVTNFMDLAEKWNDLAVWYKKKTATSEMNHGTIVIPNKTEG